MKKQKGGKYLAPDTRERGVFFKTFLPMCVSVCMALGWMQIILCRNSAPAQLQGNPAQYAVMDRYEMQMTNVLSDALDGVLAIEKVYWLNEEDQVAPEPNQSKYGKTDDPSTLGWLFEEAEKLLDGQQMHFSTETRIAPKTEVTYYLDDTILAITWKENIDWITYSFSEVKIAHPSQFRRFLAGGEYGSTVQMTTTEMAASVNAVVASSGDFYKFRTSGIIVYDGVVQKMNGKFYDTCYIDQDGNLHFTYAGEILDKETAQKFVDEHNIRFSLGFGPALVENGEVTKINNNYAVGEPTGLYPRAGLGQIDELHYVLVTANNEFFKDVPTVLEFAQIGIRLGCDKFYNLDGGQTAVLCMNDQLINAVSYGVQRRISDIIYFATAIPEGG